MRRLRCGAASESLPFVKADHSDGSLPLRKTPTGKMFRLLSAISEMPPHELTLVCVWTGRRRSRWKVCGYRRLPFQWQESQQAAAGRIDNRQRSATSSASRRCCRRTSCPKDVRRAGDSDRLRKCGFDHTEPLWRNQCVTCTRMNRAALSLTFTVSRTSTVFGVGVGSSPET